MKRYKKKEILETVDLLIEGNNYIANSCQANNKENTMEILSQCQEMAILLGNCLETFGDSGIALVPVLEDYCEKIYQFSQSLSDEFICRKIAKQMTRQLSGLKVNIIDQIPEDKIEIVFLPYKASMWDSLESVWRAAAEDPECDAYVVPIPYYERDSQGELAVMHYEGEQFPKDVPVVHYMDYNLAERRPDVAFIHNPYDQYNYVTSIHPGYYVPELKKYVGKVAYIPYFVSPEPNPDSLEAQKQKKGFVVKPGVTDTDLVFVQSEDMKRLYVNILEKEIPNISRKYWEDKIFGLGSPKLDRVHSVKRNDDLLSGEWHSIIYDGVGNRKKVIFYNTSLHDLLNQENMMEKIADTLTFFRGRKDCALWWRPHPLYESTLASMRPEWLSTYKKIVEEYIAEGWGIFDTGEDLDWAIAETDAYYGDGSSVVQLYKEAEKPVLYQDTRVKNSVEEDVEIPIWPCAFCVDGDDIWFVHGKMNVLMRYNMRENYTYIVGKVPNEKDFQDCLYAGMYKWKNRIYLIPFLAREIAIFDVKTKQFNKIVVDSIEDFNNMALFGKVYSKERNLYCIPSYYSSIVKIDMETEKLDYIFVGSKTEPINDSTQIEDKIIGIYFCTNRALVLNTVNDTISLIKLGKGSRKFRNMASTNNAVYLYDQAECSIVKVEKDNYLQGIVCGKLESEGVGMVAVGEDEIIIDPSSTSVMWIMNGNGETVTKIDEKKEVAKSSLGFRYYRGLQGNGLIDGSIFYFFMPAYSMYQFEGRIIKKRFTMSLNKNVLNELMNIMQCQDEISGENELNKLSIWTDRLIINQEKNENLTEKIGGNIYGKVREERINPL